MKMLFVIDWFIDLIMSYFMTTTFSETKNLRILKNVTAWIIKKKLRIEIIRSDEKLHRKKIIKWMRSVEIDFESSISRTQTQNKFVERSKNVIIKKIKTMTIISKIFVDLWKKVVDAAVYLHNRTFKLLLNWKFLFETFHEKNFSLTHLKIYECKIYAMIKHVQKKTNRLQKLVSKIYINWLIDYQSINIFRIWIFEKKFDKNVISTRDVLFDEKIQFDDILFDGLINLEIERIINRILFFQKEIDNANKFIKNEYIIEF